MLRARVHLRMKAARLSNRPAKLDTANSKTTALENLGLELWNRFDYLELDGDASLEDEWRELKGAVRISFSSTHWKNSKSSSGLLYW